MKKTILLTLTSGFLAVSCADEYNDLPVNTPNSSFSATEQGNSLSDSIQKQTNNDPIGEHEHIRPVDPIGEHEYIRPYADPIGEHEHIRPVDPIGEHEHIRP